MLRLPARAGPDPTGSIHIHELRNLASRLAALVHNLSEHYDDALFRDSAVGVLRDTIDRMNQMVSRYRGQPGQAIVKLKVNLNELLSSVLSEVPLRSFPRILVREEYRDVPPIWGEQYYLRSALRGIIVNALEAMPEGGALSVRTRPARGDGGARVVVEIEDTGVGMSRSFVRKRLFSPFATTKPDGLGLGLYNARQVIGLHGGSVEVRSAPSRGTLFRLRFQAAE